MLTLPPLSLYVHIPWCVRKCPYCDFNSHEAKQIPEAQYIEALIQDIQQQAEFAQGRSLVSIFFGGGTPSLFQAQSIERIIQAAKDTIGFENNIEITLEANPGTVEQGKFEGYFQAGVNRLSIGIQSFNDQHLAKLGRIHQAEHAHSAIDSARKAGFSNFNLDLMHGLPGQTTEDAMSDLAQAISHQPTHISWYQLTIEPNTEFYKYPPTLPIEDSLHDIQQQGEQQLLDAGYEQYEVSAFSQRGRQAAHNLNYWQFGDYLGIGAGAHGKITQVEVQQIIRTQKTRKPEDYLRNTQGKFTNVDSSDLMFEFLMNALRLTSGAETVLFEQRTGTALNQLKQQLQKHIEDGLIEPITEKIKTTQVGQRFLNVILERLC